MKIIFTEEVVGEDGDPKGGIGIPKKLVLWKNHRNYRPGEHPRFGQDNLLVICNLNSEDGWFLSIERFRSFLKTGIIKILK